MDNVKFKKLTPFATAPTHGSVDAAGWDLYAADSMIIPARTCVKIPTDIAIEIPQGYFGGIYPRSGLASKQGLRLANDVGINFGLV